MEFLSPIVRKYQEQFESVKDILDWVEHDLKHMGLDDQAIKDNLMKAKNILGAKHEL